MIYLWILIITLVLAEILARLIVSKSGAFNEFPKSKLKDIKKFSTYHPILGWAPIPTKTKAGDGGFTSSSNKAVKKGSFQIDEKGARFHPGRDNAPNANRKIEFFGDSTCFCRYVNDDETYQYFLERKYKAGICMNYGVGNYGIDQAYLRAEEKMEGNSTAILSMPISSLYRLGCVYKHYCELGNTWAVKSRFSKNAEGKIELIEKPFVEKEALADLSKFKDYFRKYDVFYSTYRNLQPKGIFLLHFLSNKYALYTLVDAVSKRFRKKKPVKVITSFILKGLKKLGGQKYSPSKEWCTIEDMARGELGEIFAHICYEFKSLAKSRNSDAKFFISPQGWTFRNPSKSALVFDLLKEKCEKYGIELAYFGDDLESRDASNFEKMNIYNIHVSPYGNDELASWINKTLLK